MQNLFLFLLRYRNFLLFFILELFSLFLVVRFNNRQNEIFFSSSSFFAGTFYDQRDRVQKYVNLTTVAENLAEENARLKAQFTIPAPDTSQVDTNYYEEEPQFIFHTAKVINNSIKKTKNTLTIDKGKADGLFPRMGVLGTNGVIGIVRNVSQNFAVVIPLINMQFSLSCKVKNKGYFGSLKWEGLDIHEFELRDIPKYASIAKGDTLITSGFSYIFPEGIEVGVVDTFWTIPGNDYYYTKVKIFSNFSNIEYVYPIENIMKTELDSLEQLIDE